MKVEEHVINLLTEIAYKLGEGWKVNHKITAQSFIADRESHLNNYRYFLFNQKGAFIEIYYSERGQSSLRIGYFNPKYENLMVGIKTINMNLKKGVGRVVSDINSRLLHHLDFLYSDLEKKTVEIKKCSDLAEKRSLIIHSIKMVSKSDWENKNGLNTYKLTKQEPVKSERYKRMFDTDTIERHCCTIYQQNDKPDCHHLDLYNLTTEQVIKVLALLDY